MVAPRPKIKVKIDPVSTGRPVRTFSDFWKQFNGDCSREEALEIWNAAQNAVQAKRPAQSYSQAEIDSWNAQGGSFTQDEKDRASEWR